MAKVQRFECPECEHEWDGIPNPREGSHAWETCPSCGADDGENCWDCGEILEEGNAGDKCTTCQRTLCWDCTGGQYRSFSSPHRNGREEDEGLCGATARVL
jgi:hypothetical protein